LHISFFNRKNKTNEETVIKSNAQRVAEINSAAHKATNIYLAADPDREGEAIA
jgi:DNA topoisomerase IA